MLTHGGCMRLLSLEQPCMVKASNSNPHLHVMSRRRRTCASSIFCLFLVVLASGPSTNMKSRWPPQLRAHNSALTCHELFQLSTRVHQKGKNTRASPPAPTSMQRSFALGLAEGKHLWSEGLFISAPQARRRISCLSTTTLEGIAWSQNL